MESMNFSLGEIWKKTRKSKGLTQEEVAEKLDLGTRYISDLERNKTIGSLTTLVKLCNLYEVTPTYILQQYLDVKEDIKVDSTLIGFYSLSKNQKCIVIKLIEFLNSQKEL